MSIRINLALQGGGAHGAFTWGVLERLLDEPGIEVAGISGTSAGAMNGAAFKAGMVAGGRDGARENLEWLWTEMGAVADGDLSDWLAGVFPSARALDRLIELSPGFAIWDATTRALSPYAWGPFYENPLARVVKRFNYDRVCADSPPRFFVSATNVRTGKIRVFTGDEITDEALLASACLPTLFRAVEIEGEAYWDGGYTGNPALFPLFAPDLPEDVVIVNINPLRRDELPVSASEIMNRINEISFNSSLLRELRAIHFVKRLIGEGRVPPGAMKDLRVHMIADDALMGELTLASKLVPSAAILARLREAGQAACARFLDAHGDALGRRSSLDLPGMYD